MLLLTLRGTPTLYYGDEIGMMDAEVPPDRVRDPFGLNMPGTGQGRDPERTPMPWDGSPNAGFTTGEPWLPLSEDHVAINVAAQEREAGSMLSLTRALLELRRREPSIALGDWAPLAVEGDVLAYVRAQDGQRFAVLLNLGPVPRAIPLGEDLRGPIVLSTHPGRVGSAISDHLDLGADEAVIVRLEHAAGTTGTAPPSTGDLG